MVLDYYKLREEPFGVTPDSRYLYLSVAHGEALASLLYGLETGRGFVALIAEPGLGKTTLLFHALNQLREKARTVFLFQTVCNSMDLLRALLTGLGVKETRGSLIEMQLKLKEILVEQFRLGKRVVVVIDEAQNLDDSVLELVRMLSNFETSRAKLIQIILSGQPQLAEKIGSPELVQLRQRVAMFACLAPLSREDTELYINHRMRTAGYAFEAPLFTTGALDLIAQHSEGIPRNINNLCFNALSLGCALKRTPIDCDIVREVVADLDLDRWRKKSPLGARPGERGSQEAPAFLSAAAAPSMLEGWLPRLAGALAILLVIAGALFASHRWTALKAAVEPNSAVPMPVPADRSTVSVGLSPHSIVPPRAATQAESVNPPIAAEAPSSGENQGPQPMISATTIQVTPGRTLLGLCIDKFGRCGPDLLQEIHQLNPELSNLDHIEPGQKIRVPVSGAIRSITEQQGRTSLAERVTQ